MELVPGQFECHLPNRKSFCTGRLYKRQHKTEADGKSFAFNSDSSFVRRNWSEILNRFCNNGFEFRRLLTFAIQHATYALLFTHLSTSKLEMIHRLRKLEVKSNIKWLCSYAHVLTCKSFGLSLVHYTDWGAKLGTILFNFHTEFVHNKSIQKISDSPWVSWKMTMFRVFNATLTQAKSEISWSGGCLGKFTKLDQVNGFNEQFHSSLDSFGQQNVHTICNVHRTFQWQDNSNKTQEVLFSQRQMLQQLHFHIRKHGDGNGWTILE